MISFTYSVFIRIRIVLSSLLHTHVIVWTVKWFLKKLKWTFSACLPLTATFFSTAVYFEMISIFIRWLCIVGFFISKFFTAYTIESAEKFNISLTGTLHHLLSRLFAQFIFNFMVCHCCYLQLIKNLILYGIHTHAVFIGIFAYCPNSFYPSYFIHFLLYSFMLPIKSYQNHVNFVFVWWRAAADENLRCSCQFHRQYIKNTFTFFFYPLSHSLLFWFSQFFCGFHQGEPIFMTLRETHKNLYNLYTVHV